MKKVISAFALFSLLSSVQAETQIKTLENISNELVEVRQQIESLHAEIRYEKDAYKDQMRSYSNQKSDLDVRISRTELNIKELQRELKKLADINKEKNKAQEDITPVLKELINVLRESVSTSLPFKLSQRLDAIKDIEHRLDTHLISPNKAANQLWAFVEDELMLGKSSGIYNDTLEINGQDKLVKVLRVGKVAMFYKAPDNQYGLIQRQGKQWKQQALEDDASIVQLEQLFDSFSKNIRSGQFTTPNFLPRS